MSRRIENLGDYNKVRIDLQAANGSISTLYSRIEKTAVVKAAPKLLLIGGAITMGLYYAGKKTVTLLKKRKQLIETEPRLKIEFEQALSSDMKESLDEVPENGEMNEASSMLRDDF